MTRAQSAWSLLALLSALVLPATALGQQGQQDDQPSDQQQAAGQQESQGDQPQEDAAQANQVKQLKIFQLEHITAREFSELLRRYGSQTLTGSHTAGYRGADATTGALQGGTAATQSPTEDVRIAVDDEKGLMFVRGPQKKIDEISKMVEAFDVAPGELKKHQFGDAHLIPIHEEHVQRVTKILRELQIPNAVWSVGKSQVLIFHVDPENEQSQRQMEQAQEIISRLTQEADEEASAEDDAQADDAQADDAQADDAEGENDADAQQDEDVQA